MKMTNRGRPWISRIIEAVKIRDSGVIWPGVLRVYGKSSAPHRVNFRAAIAANPHTKEGVRERCHGERRSR